MKRLESHFPDPREPVILAELLGELLADQQPNWSRQGGNNRGMHIREATNAHASNQWRRSVRLTSSTSGQLVSERAQI